MFQMMGIQVFNTPTLVDCVCLDFVECTVEAVITQQWLLGSSSIPPGLHLELEFCPLIWVVLCLVISQGKSLTPKDILKDFWDVLEQQYLCDKKDYRTGTKNSSATVLHSSIL